MMAAAAPTKPILMNTAPLTSGEVSLRLMVPTKEWNPGPSDSLRAKTMPRESAANPTPPRASHRFSDKPGMQRMTRVVTRRRLAKARKNFLIRTGSLARATLVRNIRWGLSEI